MESEESAQEQAYLVSRGVRPLGIDKSQPFG